MSDTLFESYGSKSPGDDTSASQNMNNSSLRSAMTFTPQVTHQITSVELRVYKEAGFDPGDIIVEIQGVDGSNEPDGNVLATASLDGNLWLSAQPGVIHEWVFGAPAVLTALTQYAIVIYGNDIYTSGRIFVRYNDFWTPHYDDGDFGSSSDSGSSWAMVTAKELEFYEYGIEGSGGGDGGGNLPTDVTLFESWGF